MAAVHYQKSMTSVCYIRVYIFKEFIHVSIGISTLTDKISGGVDKVGPLL